MSLLVARRYSRKVIHKFVVCTCVCLYQGSRCSLLLSSSILIRIALRRPVMIGSLLGGCMKFEFSSGKNDLKRTSNGFYQLRISYCVSIHIMYCLH